MRRSRFLVWAILSIAAVRVAAADDLTCRGTADSSCERAAVGFAPQYPDPDAAPSYETFVATLPGEGFLLDDNQDGRLVDERCNANKEAGLGAGIAALGTIVALGTACNIAPENVDIGCFAGITALALALESVSILEAQCELQDGSVNGAEIEATYENTRLLAASQIETMLLRRTHLGTLMLPRALGGRAEEVRDLVRHRLAQMIALGATPQAVAAAQADVALAESRLQAGEWKGAFRQFARAYGHLAHARK